MTEDDENLKGAVRDWQLKHRIRDDDPILATLELLQLFFQRVKIEVPDAETANVVEVRTGIQQLDRLSKDFAKQSRELIVELRNHNLEPRTRTRPAKFIFIAGACIVTGALIGKFWL
jgi:hypothetical protein